MIFRADYCSTSGLFWSTGAQSCLSLLGLVSFWDWLGLRLLIQTDNNKEKTPDAAS